MKRCPECGFRADDNICPLCGVKMKPEHAAMESLQTHAHTEQGERCGVETKKAPKTDRTRYEQRKPEPDRGRQPARAPRQPGKLAGTLLFLILIFILQSMCHALA